MRPWGRVLLRHGLALAWPAVALVVRLLLASWRLRVVDDRGVLERAAAGEEPFVFAFWHAGLIPCGVALRRQVVARGGTVAALVSRSADGELLARATASFGFQPVRGSTSRGALAGLRGLYRTLGGGGSVAITPDGPRGPARHAQAGGLQLARLSGVAIVPLAAVSSLSWHARSWDRMSIPWPFSRLTVVCGEPWRVARDESPEEAASRLKSILDAMEPRSG